MNTLFVAGYKAFRERVEPADATQGFTKEDETLWLDGWLSAWEESERDICTVKEQQ